MDLQAKLQATNNMRARIRSCHEIKPRVRQAIGPSADGQTDYLRGAPGLVVKSLEFSMAA